MWDYIEDKAGWMQTAVTVMSVVCTGALMFGILTEKVDTIGQKMGQIDELHSLLTDQKVEIIIIKKDLSVIDMRLDKVEEKI